MTELTTVQLNAPYLILIGDLTDPTYAKTGLGIVQWRPDLVAGQLRFEGCEIDMGVADMSGWEHYALPSIPDGGRCQPGLELRINEGSTAQICRAGI
jgi:hypothetical protein